MRACVLGGLILLAATIPAAAFCSEPSFGEDAPDAPGTFSRPGVPFCLRGYQWSGEHECDEWQIRSYQRDVEDYVSELNSYAQDAVDFANEAIRFAREAENYASCEADEVLTQHE